MPDLASLLDGFPPTTATQLRKLRRDLHANPELAFREKDTVSRLEAEMRALEPVDMTRVAGTGLIVRIPGERRGGPTVAIRGDIDALPIQEDTGLEFQSRNAGIMHACGHDVHASWAAGAAQLLRQRPARGDVLVIFQPAEEIGEGAAAILETGMLDGVAAIFGGHVDRRFEIGEIVAEAGPLAAAADMFEITLTGSGAHGARPHEAKDPIVGAAALVQALQTVVSRRVNPANPAVVSVGSFHSGTAANVIPGKAVLTGTLRSLDPGTRQQIQDSLTSIAQSVAAAYDLRVEVCIDRGTPPIVNEPGPVSWAREAVSRTLGTDALKPLGTLNMGGEDFAFYLESIPGCFMRIGAREKGGNVIPAHTPSFYAAEESVFIGAAVLAETARIASESLHTDL